MAVKETIRIYTVTCPCGYVASAMDRDRAKAMAMDHIMATHVEDAV